MIVTAIDGSNRKLLGVFTFTTDKEFWDWCWGQDGYKPFWMMEDTNGLTVMFENVVTGTPKEYK